MRGKARDGGEARARARVGIRGRVGVRVGVTSQSKPTKTMTHPPHC